MFYYRQGKVVKAIDLPNSIERKLRLKGGIQTAWVLKRKTRSQLLNIPGIGIGAVASIKAILEANCIEHNIDK